MAALVPALSLGACGVGEPERRGERSAGVRLGGAHLAIADTVALSARERAALAAAARRYGRSLLAYLHGRAPAAAVRPSSAELRRGLRLDPPPLGARGRLYRIGITPQTKRLAVVTLGVLAGRSLISVGAQLERRGGRWVAINRLGAGREEP